MKIAKKLVTSRKNVVDSLKRTSIDYVVMMAEECSLRMKNPNDISILASSTSCHMNFAKKVLVSIKNGNKYHLYKRSTKCNAIKASLARGNK